MSSPAIARQHALAAAFVEMAQTTTAGHTVPTVLHLLCRHCVDLFGNAASGVVLTGNRGRFEVAATCNVHSQIVLPHDGGDGQEPIAECVRTGKPVLVSDLATAERSWPGLAARVRGQGFACVHALPLRCEETILSALALFGARPGGLPLDDVHLGEALTDAAAARVVQHRALEQTQELAIQLQEALDSRVVIEQAKGALAQRGGMHPDQAFLVLRRYARNHQQPLHQLAAQLPINDHLADTILSSDASSTDTS